MDELLILSLRGHYLTALSLLSLQHQLLSFTWVIHHQTHHNFPFIKKKILPQRHVHLIYFFLFYSVPSLKKMYLPQSPIPSSPFLLNPLPFDVNWYHANPNCSFSGTRPLQGRLQGDSKGFRLSNWKEGIIIIWDWEDCRKSRFWGEDKEFSLGSVECELSDSGEEQWAATWECGVQRGVLGWRINLEVDDIYSFG